MSKHTPGPWEVGDRAVFGKDFTGASKYICDRVRGGTPGQADANTRLIAAAPELLACLKEAVLSWDLADEESDALPGDGDPLADWKAAIAKAEGE